MVARSNKKPSSLSRTTDDRATVETEIFTGNSGHKKSAFLSSQRLRYHQNISGQEKFHTFFKMVLK